jgi:Fe-S-cluster containining protein
MKGFCMKTSRVCDLCAEESLTCCQLNPGEEEFCFPLSGLEVALLTKQFPKTEGCFVWMLNSDAFVQTLMHLFPFQKEILQQRFPLGSSHLRLATDAEGRCVFRGKMGCVLSDEHRPLLCRLFPFWIVGEQFYIFEYENCPQVRWAQSFPETLAAFGTTAEALENIYDQLCLAWGIGQEIQTITPSVDIAQRKVRRLKIPRYSQRQLPAP